MILQVCAKSDVGLSRHNNEDSYAADTGLGLFVIADGMGGHAAGDVASRIAVESCQTKIQSVSAENPQKQIRAAVEQANRDIENAASNNKSWVGMGTTLSLLLCHQNRGYLGHVGDSRIYLLRHSHLEQLSDDHSLVGEQIRQGILTPEQARHSTLGNILLQALGITSELDICQKNFPLEEGDRLLLCSDGLTDMVDDARIKTIMVQNTTIDTLCRELIESALSAGGKDNITVILIQIDKLDS